jgi:hypothetical protein
VLDWCVFYCFGDVMDNTYSAVVSVEGIHDNRHTDTSKYSFLGSFRLNCKVKLKWSCRVFTNAIDDNLSFTLRMYNNIFCASIKFTLIGRTDLIEQRGVKEVGG